MMYPRTRHRVVKIRSAPHRVVRMLHLSDEEMADRLESRSRELLRQGQVQASIEASRASIRLMQRRRLR
jgi:hypothetical protein